LVLTNGILAILSINIAGRKPISKKDETSYFSPYKTDVDANMHAMAHDMATPALSSFRNTSDAVGRA
jgi:hypothetical protein